MASRFLVAGFIECLSGGFLADGFLAAGLLAGFILAVVILAVVILAIGILVSRWLAAHRFGPKHKRRKPGGLRLGSLRKF